MALHRMNSESVPVRELLGDADADRPAVRHRAPSPSTTRIRTVAGSAVATGALLGSVTQLTPAVAFAAPVADGADSVAAATPFGLPQLPAELAEPVAQAGQALTQVGQAFEDVQRQLADLQQQFVPAPAQPQAVLPVGGQISSEFGNRWGAFHNGVDIADTLGTPIRSAMGGTVLESGPASGFGLWVRVMQDDGTTAVYGHIDEYYVQAGDRVNAGDVIAAVGNRGFSTGPHLHLEIWDEAGYKVDPIVWLETNGVLTAQSWGSEM